MILLKFLHECTHTCCFLYEHVQLIFQEQVLLYHSVCIKADVSILQTDCFMFRSDSADHEDDHNELSQNDFLLNHCSVNLIQETLQCMNDDEKEIFSSLKSLSSEISLQLSDENVINVFISDWLKNLSQKIICLIFLQNSLILHA